MRRTIFTKTCAFMLLLAMVPSLVLADWISFQGDGRHTGSVDEEITGKFKLDWERRTDSKFLAPVYADGTIYLTETTENSHALTALNKENQEQIWQYQGAGSLDFAPVVYDGRVIIAGDRVTALKTTTGEKIWEGTGIGQRFLYPTVESPDYYIYSDQSERTKLPSENAQSKTEPKMALVPNNIYVWNKEADGNYLLYAFDTFMGWKQWVRRFSDVNKVTYPSTIYKNFVNYTYETKNGRTETGVVDFMDGETFTTGYFKNQPASPLILGNNEFYYYTTEKNEIAIVDATDPFDLKLAETFPLGKNATLPLYANSKVYALSNNFLNNNLELHSFSPSYYYDDKYNVVYEIGHDVFTLAENKTLDPKTLPIIVGEQMYIPFDKGEIWRVDLSDGNFRKFKLAPSGESLTSLIYAGGTFIATSKNQRNLYAFSFDPTVIETDKAIELISPYKTDDNYNEYLGQTHSHYIPDDPRYKRLASPRYTVQKYRDAGYQFIALTEHNIVTPNPKVSGITFIENAEEDTQGLFNTHIVGLGIKTPANENLSNQERIDQFYSQGGFISMPHPNSFFYQWTAKELLELNRYDAIEVFNTSADTAGKFLEPPRIGGRSNASDKWDELLSNRKIEFSTAGDDFTPYNPGDGFDNGAVVVFAKDSTQEEILKNLKEGNFYALQGSKAPRIKVAVEDGKINIISNQKSKINFIGNKGKTLQESEDVNSASYEPTGDEIYVRAEVIGQNKLKTWSQPVIINKHESTPIQTVSSIIFDQGKLDLSNPIEMTAKTLNPSEYPESNPNWGYLSPIYSFESDEVLNEPAKLEIDYSQKKILVAEDKLAIFAYNAAKDIWEKVSSTVDKINKKVTAQLDHFSLYTLSSDEAGDKQAPSLELALLDSCGKETPPVPQSMPLVFSQENPERFIIRSEDNNQVYNISGYLDEKDLLFSDSDYQDNFDQIIDFSKYPLGNHKLTLISEDTFGNSSKKEFSVSLEKSKSLILKPCLKL